MHGGGLYVVEEVPIDDYTIPLGQAEVLRKGADLTVVSYGTPLHICCKSKDMMKGAIMALT